MSKPTAMTVHNTNKLPVIPIQDLLPTQGNLKDLDETNYGKLKSNIERRGFIDPVAVWVDPKTNLKYILNGHQRQRVLIKEGWNNPIPYFTVPAQSLQEAAAIVLELTSQYGKITQEGLDEHIAKYELPEAQIYDATHFDALTVYEDAPEPEIEEDEAPEVSSEPPVSELGKIYQLGKHRVMCGDATNETSLTELMDWAVADMVFTDPPYGMDYSGRGKDTSNKIMGDTLDPTTFYSLGQEITERYIWGRIENYSHLPEEPRDTIIWRKNNFGMGRGYRGQYECCYYYGDFSGSDSDVWDLPKDSKYEHPTQKPVSLCARAIKNSQPNIVIDYFLGSGSTLIACEQTDRICYGMELDPKYVDVIRKRYAKFIQPDNELPENWQELTPEIAR